MMVLPAIIVRGQGTRYVYMYVVLRYLCFLLEFKFRIMMFGTTWRTTRGQSGTSACTVPWRCGIELIFDTSPLRLLNERLHTLLSAFVSRFIQIIFCQETSSTTLVTL